MGYGYGCRSAENVYQHSIDVQSSHSTQCGHFSRSVKRESSRSPICIFLILHRVLYLWVFERYFYFQNLKLLSYFKHVLFSLIQKQMCDGLYKVVPKVPLVYFKAISLDKSGIHLIQTLQNICFVSE